MDNNILDSQVEFDGNQSQEKKLKEDIKTEAKEDIKPESRFMEDLGFTSFDFMSMLGEIEDELDVEIDQGEAADIRTVQEAIDYLEKISK